LLSANKRLNTAYVLKESFGQLWGYEREGWARRFLENWRASLKWQRLKPYWQRSRDGRRDRCCREQRRGKRAKAHSARVHPARPPQSPSAPRKPGATRETLTARPISQELRPRRSALDGNPIEHGNIQVFETGGQSRYRAMGLRHDDLRMHDHGGERFDHGVVTARLHRAAPSLRRIVCTKWHASPTQRLRFLQPSLRTSPIAGCSARTRGG
jgi:hypothetical protein